MKGTKMELQLEHEAIVEAVQMWVDKYYTAPAPKVISVDKSEGGKGQYDKKKIFTIDMEVQDEIINADLPSPSV